MMKEEKVKTQMLKTSFFLPHTLKIGKFFLGILSINLLLLVGCGETEIQNAPLASSPTAKSVLQEEKLEKEKTGEFDPAKLENVVEEVLPIYTYNPEGRRDPFRSILQITENGGGSLLPPLQRLGLLQLKLIGVVWGGFGYSAMLQSSDGRGYTVNIGTVVGPNQGIVKEITARNLLVRETFTDVFGEKKIRDFVFKLHPQEGLE